MVSKYIHVFEPQYVVYLRDESRTIGHAEYIAFPRNETELLSVLTEAYATGQRITIQGARTGLAAAAVPKGGLILNLTRMNKILGLRQDVRGRFFVRLQPGVVLSQLRKRIEDKRFETTGWNTASLEVYRIFRSTPEQFFPSDPTESSCTLGGMVACNASGARSYLYGPVRGHISEVKMALADGDTVTLQRGATFAKKRSLTLNTDGGKVMILHLPSYTMPNTKNASGYYVSDDMDAIDLLIGSDGTLGVVTEIEIGLLNLPSVIWGVACFFRDENTALDFVIRIRAEINCLAAIEFFDSRTLRILSDAKREKTAFSGLPTIPDGKTCVYVEIHADDELTAKETLFELGNAMESYGDNAKNTWVARTAFDRDKLIFFRHAAPECVNMIIDERKKQDQAITKLGTDMAVPNKHLKTIMNRYHADLESLGLQYAIWGHIGNNHLHVNVLPRNAIEHAHTKAIYKKWTETVSKLGGSVSAEHGVGKLKTVFLQVMYGDNHITEMKHIKAVFDPKGLLGVDNMFVLGTKTEETVSCE
jgi:D-lactate dehydrogenase (cytochrome)